MAIFVPERETVTTKPSPKDKLREAADLLENNGWIQGRPFDDIGQHCAVGAIMEVCGAYQDAYDSALYTNTVQLLQDCIETSVVSWNDRFGQTKQNVIETMRACASK